MIGRKALCLICAAIFQTGMSAHALTPQISAGLWNGFAAVDANGVIWTAGTATVNYSSQPARLQSIADAKSVSMGTGTSWIIRFDDSLWGAGSNNYGELGIGNPGSTIISEPVKSLPGTGVTTLWAWDNASAKWYFYAPSLEAQGGTALSGYITNKGYLDFAIANKKLGNGTGFWVNR